MRCRVCLLALWACAASASLGCGGAENPAQPPAAAARDGQGGQESLNVEVTANAAAPSASETPPGPLSQLVVRETSLGRLLPNHIPASVVTSPDAAHVAWVVLEDDQARVLVDGRPQAKRHLDAYLPLVFSPDGNRLAYKVRTESPSGSKRAVVIDGTEGPSFDSIFPSEDDRPVFFSPDGKRAAYVGFTGDLEKGGTSVAVVDGVRGKPHAGSMTSIGVVWSPDSRRWSYAVNDRSRGKSAVVNDDVRGPEYDRIAVSGWSTYRGAQVIQTDYLMALLRTDLSFSADGAHLAYAAGRGDESVVVLDGNEVTRERGLVVPDENTGLDGGIGFVQISPDGRRLAYRVMDANRGRSWIVLDGKRSKEYQGLDIGGGFSPDSRHYAFFAKPTMNRRVVVLDGVEGQEYDAPPLDDARPDDLQFSPDGSRLAARMHRDGKQTIVIHGTEGTKYDAVGPVAFSPNGRRHAYPARLGSRLFLVVDGAEGKAYDDLGADSPRFSPDGRHVACGAVMGRRWRIVVDAVETREGYDNILAHPRFAGPGRVRAIAVRDDEVFRLEIELGYGSGTRTPDPAPVVGKEPRTPVAGPSGAERVIETDDPEVLIELYTDRAKFDARLGETRVIGFDDLETTGTEPVPFKADRYRQEGILITGSDEQFAGRSFSYPSDYVPTSKPNMYAPGPRAKPDDGKDEGGHETDVTFVAGGRPAAVAGFGAVFIDADYPGLGPCRLGVFGRDGKLLAEDKPITGPSGKGVFRGMIAVDSSGRPVSVLRRFHIVSGSGWPEVYAAEGVTLDDFVFGVPVALE